MGWRQAESLLSPRFAHSRRKPRCAVSASRLSPDLRRRQPGMAEYPDRPIHLIVPQAAGSATDTLARLFAASLGERIGQQVIVDDRPGGALTVGLDLTAKSAPDGYTLCMGPIGALAHHAAHGGAPALRHRARLPADRAGDARPSAARGVADSAVPVGQGTDRLRQGESRKAARMRRRATARPAMSAAKCSNS